MTTEIRPRVECKNCNGTGHGTSGYECQWCDGFGDASGPLVEPPTKATLVIEECAGCVEAFAKARRCQSRERCAACGERWYGDTSNTPRRGGSTPPQRTAPPTVTLAPCPDRNRRKRDRPWNLVADMSILARHFSAIEGRAQSIEPSVQNGGARDENDKRNRERATAVLIHQRWRALPGLHASVIEYLFIRRDGSKLADDDERTAPAVAKARETAFERCAVAFASKAQRTAWQATKQRSVVQGSMRLIGRRMFEAAKGAYEHGK